MSAQPAEGFTIRHVPERERYVVQHDGREIGHLRYRRPDEGHVDLVHTEVDDDFGGRGLASELVAAAAADARAQHLRVIPHCPYAARWFRRHDEYADLVDWPSGGA